MISQKVTHNFLFIKPLINLFIFQRIAISFIDKGITSSGDGEGSREPNPGAEENESGDEVGKEACLQCT